MTLGDIIRYNTDTSVCTTDGVITLTKDLLGYEAPYVWVNDPADKTHKVPIFSNRFIAVFKSVMNNLTLGCIANMTVAERQIWYDFIDYQNGATFTGDTLLVLEELDDCLEREIEEATETYLERRFSVTHTWDSCPLTI